MAPISGEESRGRCDMAREEMDGCTVCMGGKAMEQFTEEGIDHMEWDRRKERFVKTNPQEPPLMEVKVRVLYEVQKQFLGRKAKWWRQLGRSKPVGERGMADTGAQVCTAGLSTIEAMGLQVNMLAKTRLVVRGVKGSRLTVLEAVAVEISAGGKISYQILYVTEETRLLLRHLQVH